MAEKDYIRQYLIRTPRSRALFERAQKTMPGGVSHRFRFFPPYPFYVEKVNGSKIWDVDGNEYVDFWMGHFALILGHKAPPVQDALKEVVEVGTHWGTVHEHEIRFAELLQKTVPCAEKVIFGVSGTEATMHALRLARGFTKKRVILKVAGGWHGANNDLLWAIRGPFERPESSGVISEVAQYTQPIIFNDLEATLKMMHRVREDLAAVIIEPVVGSGGMIPAKKEYLEMLRQETRKSGALLIFDEIITGYRVALGGAQEVYGIKPDLVTMGKVCGGGANLGVIAGRGDILALCDGTVKRTKGESVMVGGGTFSCSPFSMIVGYRVVEYLRDHAPEIYSRIGKLGQRLREGMEQAFAKNGLLAKTTGLGSLCGLYFPHKPETVVQSPTQMYELTNLEKVDQEFRLRMLNRGVFVMHGGGAVSFAHTEEDMARVLQAAAEVAQEMKKVNS